MAKGKTKIPVHEKAPSLTGNPFASLDGGGLPDGPTPPAEPAPAPHESATGEVILRREKARRGGKTVVVAGSFATTISDAGLEALAKRARQSCGCGGTFRNREIELQGDDPARFRKFFESAGFRVRGETGRPD